MLEKKEQNKFTIQFNAADPSHRQVADVLNQQGRRKAQFLVNAVQHYLYCPETPDIPQAAPVDTCIIEDIVRRIMGKQCKAAPVIQEPAMGHMSHPEAESIHYDEAAGMLGEDGLAAIANSIAAFRNGDKK